MSTKLDQALSAHFALVPGVGVGALRFGDRVSDHPQLVLRDPEPGFAGDNHAEYGFAGIEQTPLVDVDELGKVDTISFYDVCLLDGHELVGMGVGELLVRLGLPDAIEAEEIGRELELLYAYDSLGLTLWTIEGEVCVVQASAPRAARR